MSHVFLSYSHKDTDFMRRLRSDLHAEGLDVWIDETGLEPGTPAWEDTIADAIERAGCLVVVLSPDAKESRWVGRELGYAEEHDVPIFPVLARGNERSAVPIRLINAHWVDARRDYEGAVHSLVAALCKHLGIESLSQKRQREEKEEEEERIRQAEAQLEEARRKEKEAARVLHEAEEERLRLEAARQARQETPKRPRPARKPKPSAPSLRPLAAWNPLDHLRLLGWILLAPDRLLAYRKRVGGEAVKRVGTWLASTLTWLPLLIPTLALGLGTLPISKPGWYGLLVVGLALGWVLTGWLRESGDELGCVLTGLVFGLPGAALVVVIADSVAGGMALGTTLGTTLGATLGVALGATLGVALGMALVAAVSVASRLEADAGSGVAFGVAVGVATSVSSLAAFGVAAVVPWPILSGVMPSAMAIVVAIAVWGIFALVYSSFQESFAFGKGQLVLAALVLSHATLVWICFLGGWQMLAPPG